MTETKTTYQVIEYGSQMVVVKRFYTVDADSPEEAIQKVKAGTEEVQDAETLDEYNFRPDEGDDAFAAEVF